MNPKKVYVRELSRKSCPSCKAKKTPLSFGEYLRAKWHTIEHCCEDCFSDRMAPLVKQFEKQNNREVEFVGYQGFGIPEWVKVSQAV